MNTYEEYEKVITELEGDTTKLTKQSPSSDQVYACFRTHQLKRKLAESNDESMQPLKERVAKIDQALTDLLDI